VSQATKTLARQIAETLYNAETAKELYTDSVNTTLEMARHCSYQDLYLRLASSQIPIDGDLHETIIEVQVSWLIQTFSNEDLYAISLMLNHLGCRRFVEASRDLDHMRDHGVGLVHEKTIGAILAAAEELEATIVLPSKKESESN